MVNRVAIIHGWKRPRGFTIQANIFCLFVWLNKTRTVKPLRRFHFISQSWRLSFTPDGFAFSTKTARRTLPENTPSPAQVGIVHKLTGWFGFQGQQTMLTSPDNASPTQDAS